jgi:hypothetical protein
MTMMNAAIIVLECPGFKPVQRPQDTGATSTRLDGLM